MKRVLMSLAVMVLVLSFVPGLVPAAGVQKQLNWGAVTTYTNGAPIEASKAVTYNAWMDNVPLAVKTPNNWVLFTVPDYNVTHQFTAQTELSTGEKSVVTTPFSWTSPAAVPSTPSPGCSITDPTH